MLGLRRLLMLLRVAMVMVMVVVVVGWCLGESEIWGGFSRP
jgi:hypothetical protein